MSVADIGRMRFAYSPLAEVAETLYMIAAGRIGAFHRGWYVKVRDDLGRCDLATLTAVVPARSCIADFLFTGATDSATTIEQQLDLVANMPPAEFRRQMQAVWGDEPIPPAGVELIEDGTRGTAHLAELLWDYWSVAIRPHWPQMRAVFEDDVAFRVAELTKGGLQKMLAGLHPSVSVDGTVLRIDKPQSGDEDLAGAGLVLVPSVFVWPSVIFAINESGPCTLTYAARGVGNLWRSTEESLPYDDDPLGALMGRSRAAILTRLALPMSTTELAQKLSQSAPSVSAHLAVLKRSGLVTSWRKGRSVLYRRTPLATSVVSASNPAADHERPA